MLFTLHLLSQKVQTASGKYTYHASENLSIEEAKRIAINRAKTQAITNLFGTTVAQSNSTIITNKNGNSETQFFSIGDSEVKGVWIGDTKEPFITISYEDNMLVVTAEVFGKRREKTNSEFDLYIQVLCNGKESESFFDKDRLSLSFCSPVKGYLSIWLADDYCRRAYCLLPYDNSDGGAYPIDKRNVYNLLSTSDPMYPYHEETILTTDNDIETNRLVIIFSTSNFSIPLTNKGEFLPELSTEKFDKWLMKNRVRDENMCVIKKLIEIRKK